MAAGNARDVIKRTRKVVHHLAFALIAPLRAHHHDGFHSSSFSSHAPAHQGSAPADRGRTLTGRLRDLRSELSGDPVIESAQEPTPPTLLNRVQRVVGNTWSTTQAPTATHRRNYEIASQELAAFLPRLQGVLDELRKLETDAEAAGAPWTPGRLPVWKP